MINNHEYNGIGLYTVMKHSPERLLKLRPYPILDTDPTLTISSHSTSNKVPQSVYAVGQSYKPNDVLKYHKDSRKLEENRNHLDQVKLNISGKSTDKTKSYNVSIKQPPVHLKRKVLPQLFNVATRTPKIGGLSSLKNDNFNYQDPQNKDAVDITDEKIQVNHVRAPTSCENKEKFEALNLDKYTPKEKKTLIRTKELKANKPIIDRNDLLNFKPEFILNTNNISVKEKPKLPVKIGTITSFKRNMNVDNIKHNTSLVKSWNSHALNLSTGLSLEKEKKHFQSPIMNVPNKNTEHEIISNEPKKSVFNNLFSGTDTPKQKVKSKMHSALRPSLFSNMPPYIRFFSYDIKGETFPLPLQVLLKWKLSSITPIVVRRTIQNSGFKLVRSEHSLFNNPNDSTTITDQSNQNTISLQNYCGNTPPIVDAFCGTISPPNELMMLPLSSSNDWVGTWAKYMKSLCFKTLDEHQKLNHIPGTFQIGRKDWLWRNLHRLMLKYSLEEFGFIPTSYILPQETNILHPILEKNDEDKWIVKPPASARGSGIRVISKWNQLPKKVPLVVQKYIDNPYLINDTKFDLRLYILVTSINPLRLYLYDNGLVRFASVKYSSDITTISDRYMHLTNYSINRLSSQYTQNEDADACQGHKWTLRALWTYMEKERNVDVKKLWNSLEDLVIKTLISGESPINQFCCSNLSSRYSTYELFGIDVLFDEFLKPWLLEVNISPSLHSSSSLDLAVKGPLIKDVMNMVGYHLPNKMSPETHSTLLKMLGIDAPLCYDKRLYAFNLSAKEQEKQKYYTNLKSRDEYIHSILDDLLPDDVRHLITFEDELTQIGSFKKVFPTTTSHEYHKFFDGPRYYNMLIDAWECKYSGNRKDGIAVLEEFCKLQVHLQVPDIDEEQSKACDSSENTQFEDAKMFDKSGGDKTNDNRQPVVTL